jgi:hypothetical protein
MHAHRQRTRVFVCVCAFELFGGGLTLRRPSLLPRRAIARDLPVYRDLLAPVSRQRRARARSVPCRGAPHGHRSPLQMPRRRLRGENCHPLQVNPPKSGPANGHLPKKTSSLFPKEAYTMDKKTSDMGQPLSQVARTPLSTVKEPWKLPDPKRRFSDNVVG